jgi:hypothetical protein
MADAARAFFDRLAPIGYLESWSGILEERSTRRDLHDRKGIRLFCSRTSALLRQREQEQPGSPSMC